MPGYNFQENILFFCLKVFFTFTNSVDLDEMQHYAAFHLGLHCLQGLPQYKGLSIMWCLIRVSTICLQNVPLTPSLPYIMHAIRRGKIRLFLCSYGVTYNFIQNLYHCRDLHQFFSCLFKTFGTMSEIMFSIDSMSKKNSTAENTLMSSFVYNIIVFGTVGKQWFKNVKMTGISSFTIANSN